MYFPFFVNIENGLSAFYFSSIFLLEYRVVPMQEFMLSNCYKTMPVNIDNSVVLFFLRTQFSILFDNYRRIFRSHCYLMDLWYQTNQ